MSWSKLVVFPFSVALVFALSACATTESTTETFGNTTEATTGFTSSTSPDRDSESHDSKDDGDKAAAISFAGKNMAKLRRDAMSGNGEYVDSVGLLLGVKKERLPEYGKMVRENFDDIFTAEEQSPEDLVAKLDEQITKRPILRKL